jgi:hypothetical protein
VEVAVLEVVGSLSNWAKNGREREHFGWAKNDKDRIKI